MESLGQHYDTLHGFLLNWGFWYLIIAERHRVIHSDSQKVPRRYVTQLGWMSPPKVGSLVWFLVPLRILNFEFFHGCCWENFSLYRRDRFFPSLTYNVIRSLFSKHLRDGLSVGDATLLRHSSRCSHTHTACCAGHEHGMSETQLMVPNLAR